METKPEDVMNGPEGEPLALAEGLAAEYQFE
jgi:hypothetical protein